MEMVKSRDAEKERKRGEQVYRSEMNGLSFWRICHCAISPVEKEFHGKKEIGKEDIFYLFIY